MTTAGHAQPVSSFSHSIATTPWAAWKVRTVGQPGGAGWSELPMK